MLIIFMVAKVSANKMTHKNVHSYSTQIPHLFMLFFVYKN